MGGGLGSSKLGAVATTVDQHCQHFFSDAEVSQWAPDTGKLRPTQSFVRTWLPHTTVCRVQGATMYCNTPALPGYLKVGSRGTCGIGGEAGVWEGFQGWRKSSSRTKGESVVGASSPCQPLVLMNSGKSVPLFSHLMAGQRGGHAFKQHLLPGITTFHEARTAEELAHSHGQGPGAVTDPTSQAPPAHTCYDLVSHSKVSS